MKWGGSGGQIKLEVQCFFWPCWGCLGDDFHGGSLKEMQHLVTLWESQSDSSQVLLFMEASYRKQSFLWD
jgi:hypothetical protein